MGAIITMNMNDFFVHNDGLDPLLFVIVFIFSSFLFYCGYFLMIRGSTRQVSWTKFFFLKIPRKGFGLRWSGVVGFLLHILGRIAPFVYIYLVEYRLIFFARVLLILTILLLIIDAIKKFLPGKTNGFSNDIEIIKKDIIDFSDAEGLWKIYDDTFEPLNRKSPCKQSLDRDHFMEAMNDVSVAKYLISKKGSSYIGLGLITNNFKNTPWISEDYFKFNYPDQFQSRSIYYFMGIAIDKSFRGNSYSVPLIEYIIDDLPKNIIIGFDHSININPSLHYFTHIIKQANLVKRTHIDKQHYHVVEYRK